MTQDSYYFGKCKVCKTRTQITKDVPEVIEDQVGWCLECIREDNKFFFEYEKDF